MTLTLAVFAFIMPLIAGISQIVGMIRQRSSHAQSAVGWAAASNGAVATTSVGLAKNAPSIVVMPSAVGAGIAAAGLGVTLYYRYCA